MAEPREPNDNFSELVEIVKILRKECPWDRKQTHQSIKDNLIEEAYEAVEAIDKEDVEGMTKELGDVLLHVVFHSNMADEEDVFSIDEVIYAIQDKLIRRHPHVFGNTEVENEADIEENWEAMKQQEGRKSVLDGIPQPLPALIRARRMQEKAANVGFDWPEFKDVWDKLEEELDELKQTFKDEDQEKSRKEFGDLLFSLVNAGRHLDLNAEDSLRQTNKKFINRFQYIEEQLKKENKPISDSSLQEMDRYWEQAKSQE